MRDIERFLDTIGNWQLFAECDQRQVMGWPVRDMVYIAAFSATEGAVLASGQIAKQSNRMHDPMVCTREVPVLSIYDSKVWPICQLASMAGVKLLCGDV